MKLNPTLDFSLLSNHIKTLRRHHGGYPCVGELQSKMLTLGSSITESFGVNRYTKGLNARLEGLSNILSGFPSDRSVTPTWTNGLMNALRLLGAFPNVGERMSHFYDRLQSYVLCPDIPSFQLGAFHLFDQSDLIGSGGYSDVYRGVFTKGPNNYPVAVKKHKVIVDGSSEYPLIWSPEQMGVISSWLAELCYLADLKMAHTAMSIFAWGFDKHGNPFTVSDLAEESVRSWIQSNRTQGQGNDETVGCIALGALNSIAHIHNNDVVHRDIKPANAVLMKKPQELVEVRSIDFGTSRTKRELELLEKGQSHHVGTLGYMAPEVQDQFSARGDIRTDVYAAGAFLLSMYTGEVDGGKLDVLARYGVGRGMRLPTIPVKVMPVIVRALDRDPSKRFANGEVLRNAYARAIGASD